ncbi:MAG TPA: PTS sugar transporter subunit IIA [Candidatus Latescibacteria bacterium]|nr:PTS sugar transporter subunit IIA [Candidatus Latescibacterota bacterium]
MDDNRPGFFLPSHRVAVGLKARDSFEAIRELCGLLEGDPDVVDIKVLRSALIRRERVESTALGNGVAVPHAHSNGVRSLVVCLGISKRGVEFYAADGGPVYIVAMVCAPDRNFRDYLGYVKELARTLGQEEVQEALLEARNPKEVMEGLCTGGGDDAS